MSLAARNDDLCPVAAMKNHLSVNCRAPQNSSIFTYRSATGWTHLFKHVFMDFCNDSWGHLGLGFIAGHSFRIGGAVELLLAGVPPEVVAAIGGWSSLAFLLYWRKVDEILPLCTAKAYRKQDFDELAKMLESFRVRHNIDPRLLQDYSQI